MVNAKEKRAIVVSSLGKWAKKIDDAILDYVVGIIDDAITDEQELCDQIGPFIQSSGCDISDAEMLKICQTILSSLLADKPAQKKAEMKLLNAPVNLGELSKKMEETQVTSLFAERERRLPSQDQKQKEAALKQQQIRDKRAGKKDGEKEKVAEPDGSRNKENFGVIKRSNNPNNLKLSRDIQIDNIDLNFGATELLKGASLSLSFGRRYGLVGRNGAGKSSLLRALANRELNFPSHIQILHVEQEVIGDETTAIDSVLESDTERTELLREEKDLLNQINATPITTEASGTTTTETSTNTPPTEATTTATKSVSAPLLSSHQKEDKDKPKTNLDARLSQIYTRTLR
eukprot:TRINITY_DN6990_c0_g1_i1.p1 TRINITY_DN6990_c0_g1~~TRINITY_DN6990_c0_g1_i1.p1  ORF type:complete len:346 (-),score=117.25 TRINITY_DN6990_c0_g1_i1:5-1042(-)